MAGVARVKECLDLQLASCGTGQRIRQVCCIDHATFRDEARAHLHLQIHFSNGDASPWFQLSRVTLSDLRTAIAALPNNVRIHLHEEDQARRRTEPSFAESLPRGKLAASSLLPDTCPVCLAAFATGDELVVLPCQGLHKTHWECLQPWLATAHTCPTCRFELPTTKGGAESELVSEPMRRAWAEVRRLEQPPPAVWSLPPPPPPGHPPRPQPQSPEPPPPPARGRAGRFEQPLSQNSASTSSDGDARGPDHELERARARKDNLDAELPASGRMMARPLALTPAPPKRPGSASGAASPSSRVRVSPEGVRSASPSSPVSPVLPLVRGEPVPLSRPASWVVAEGTVVAPPRPVGQRARAVARRMFSLRS